MMGSHCHLFRKLLLVWLLERLAHVWAVLLIWHSLGCKLIRPYQQHSGVTTRMHSTHSTVSPLTKASLRFGRVQARLWWEPCHWIWVCLRPMIDPIELQLDITGSIICVHGSFRCYRVNHSRTKNKSEAFCHNNQPLLNVGLYASKSLVVWGMSSQIGSGHAFGSSLEWRQDTLAASPRFSLPYNS